MFDCLRFSVYCKPFIVCCLLFCCQSCSCSKSLISPSSHCHRSVTAVISPSSHCHHSVTSVISPSSHWHNSLTSVTSPSSHWHNSLTSVIYPSYHWHNSLTSAISPSSHCHNYVTSVISPSSHCHHSVTSLRHLCIITLTSVCLVFYVLIVSASGNAIVCEFCVFYVFLCFLCAFLCFRCCYVVTLMLASIDNKANGDVVIIQWTLCKRPHFVLHQKPS